MKIKFVTAMTVLVLMLGSVGLSGCRRDEKVTATPQGTKQQLLPSVGGSPLPTPGTGLSPLNP